jgi:hypothetical protein
MRAAIVVGLGLTALVATTAAAQWIGEPVWNSPSAGTGLTISGDYARPDSAYGKGNTWGGRASLGLSTMTLTAGVASWKPNGATTSITSVGGNVAFRLIGGSLLPVAVNMQLGGSGTTSTPKATELIGAVGISVPLPTPGFSIEPYFSPGIRYHNGGGTNTTKFGYAFGANLGFGVLGVHLAYDHESRSSNAGGSVFGVGLHAGLHLPMGL